MALVREVGEGPHFLEKLLGQRRFRNSAKACSFSEYKARPFAAGDADIGLGGFSRAVNDTSHDRDLKRRGNSGEGFFDTGQ